MSTNIAYGAYVRACTEDSDIVDHVPRLAALCVELDAQHVIELGVRAGVSTAAFLHGLGQTGGRLTSVDIAPAPLGFADNWTFIRSDDLDASLLDALEPAEIVFIDTSHHYAHTRAELAAYLPLTRPGGRIVLHDTELEWPAGSPDGDPAYPVKTAVTEFCAEHGFAFTNNPACNGLAEIVVPA